MPTIIIPVFAGEVPLREPALLENIQASRAVNCNFERGSLQALRGPSHVTSLPSYPAATIFKHPVDGWVSWNREVSVIKSAVIDVLGETPLGQLLITGDREYPTQYLAGGDTHRLGLPRPALAPEVNLGSGVALANVTVSGFVAATKDQVPQRYGSQELAPIEINSGTLTASQSYEEDEIGINRSTSYCYTFVRNMADGVIQQESAPSPASPLLDVMDGDGVTVSGFQIPDMEDVNITHIRIYRTVGGMESAEFRFVAEIPATQESYLDTAHDKDIDLEVLRTSLWDPIPDDARGLIKTDNGIYAAFRGNELLVSEPFVPYAFPDAYRLTVEDQIVALSHVDNTIVVLTKGRPYLAQGQEPESLQLINLPIEQACVSARSVSTLPGGVVYASPDGLMLFTANEQTLLTRNVLTREQWQDFGPETLMGEMHEDSYIGFFAGTGRGFIFDLERKDIVRIELPEGNKAHALYRHTEDDRLYLAVETSAGSNFVCAYGQGAPLPFIWRTKEYFTSALRGMAALRVVGRQKLEEPLKVAVYGPGSVARATLVLTDGRSKRVPTTRVERFWSVELSGTGTVYELRMGTGVEALESGE